MCKCSYCGLKVPRCTCLFPVSDRISNHPWPTPLTPPWSWLCSATVFIFYQVPPHGLPPTTPHLWRLLSQSHLCSPLLSILLRELSCMALKRGSYMVLYLPVLWVKGKGGALLYPRNLWPQQAGCHPRVFQQGASALCKSLFVLITTMWPSRF